MARVWSICKNLDHSSQNVRRTCGETISECLQRSLRGDARMTLVSEGPGAVDSVEARVSGLGWTERRRVP